MVYSGIQIPVERVAELCRKHQIRRLSLFGSVLTPEFRPDSDIDVLVEFEPGRAPGLAFYGIEGELSELLGRRVDLNTKNSLSRYFRDSVLAQARPIYATEE